MPSFNGPVGRIHFEQRGSRANPPVILVHGLGCQLIHWPDSLIDGIVAAGLRCIMPDNRGTGLSDPIDAPAPAIEQLVAMQSDPSVVEPHFTLSDLAADVVALLDHIGQSGAHLVGLSMGGMVAQRTAAEHPTRVHSLTAIMSSSGNPDLPEPNEVAVSAMVAAQTAEGRDAVLTANRNVAKVIGGDEPQIRPSWG